MGCGGSKAEVATGNTTANACGKLLLRNSSVSTRNSSSSSNNIGVAVKDVVKDPAAGEAKAGIVDVTCAEKSITPAVVEEKREEVVVVRKDVAAAAPAVDAMVTEAVAAPTPKSEQVSKVVEEELPESTMTDEAVVEEAPKVDEANEVALNDQEEKKVEESKNVEKAMSPAPTNEDGESVGQQNTTEPLEAKPVDEHRVEEVAVSESLSEKKDADAEQTAAATTRSEPPAN